MGNEICGIYAIRSLTTGRLYVGSTVAIYVRWSQHRRLLRQNKHKSPYLQNAWKKYGENDFEFEILERCERDVLIAREQFWMDSNRDRLFNLAPAAGSRLGVPQRPEVIEKVRQKALGSKRTPEQRARMSAAMKGVAHPKAVGQKFSRERRDKISAAHKGKVRLGARGKPKSEEHRRKISEAQKGVPRLYALGSKRSKATRKKMSAAMKGNQNGRKAA